MVYRIYVASYANEIYTLSFSPESSSLILDSSLTVGFHPSWLTSLPSDRTLVFTGLEQNDGQIVAIKFGQKGQGKIVGTAPSGGADPASLLATDTELLIGNYTSGVFTTIPVVPHPPYLKSAESVSLKITGTGPNKERQEGSHPHQVILHPHRDELLVPDLGADKTWRLKKNAKGAWEIAGHVSYKPGSGPRHVAFYNDILYTVLELTSEVSAHRLPPLPAEPTHLATVPTMSKPPGPPAETGMLAAEILLPAPSKAFPTPYLYVSNRNDPSPEGDIIAVYSVANPDRIELVAEVRSGLRHLRGMLFGGPDDQYLVAGGAHGPGVKVFQRTDGGRGLREVASIGLPAPTGFLWG